MTCADHLDRITLKGWVGEGDTPDTLIQDSSLDRPADPGLLAGRALPSAA